MGVGQPVMYWATWRRLVVSLPAAVMLSHLVHRLSHLQEACDDQPVAFPDEQLMATLGITPHEIRSAKRRLKRLKFLEVTVRGLPATTHYRVCDWGLLHGTYDRLQEVSNGQ